MGKGKNGIGFGKVDITVEKELQTEFNIKEAPELKLFFEGNRSEPISCKGNSACVSIKAMLAMEKQTPAFQWCNKITNLLLAHEGPAGCQRVEVGGSAPHVFQGPRFLPACGSALS